MEASKTNFKKLLESNKFQKEFWGWVFVTPWILGFLIFFAYPFLNTIWYSLNIVKPKNGMLEIISNGIENYKFIFTDLVIGNKPFVRVLVDSTWYMILNLPIVLIFSLFIAVLLNTKFKGRAIVRAMFFIPVIYNATAISIALNGMFSGYMDNTGALSIFEFKEVLLGFGLARNFIEFLISVVDRIMIIINISGVQILIFLAALKSIPAHLYEAAQIEGATKYESFWKVTFPMVSPIFLTIIVYTVIDSFLKSEVVNFIEFVRVDMHEYGLSSAMSVVYFLINILVLLVIYLIVRKGVHYYD